MKYFQYILTSIALLTLTSMPFEASAQDSLDEAEESATFKAPKRKVVEDKNPLIEIQGNVMDYVTQKPVAGVRVKVLGNSKYTAMTNAEGKFVIKVPTFATALYVEAPRYSAQQVAIHSNESNQQINITLLSDKFLPMYGETTDYTASSSFKAKGGSVVIDNEIQTQLGADIRSIAHSGMVDGGNAMFIRGLNSLNANAQPLIIVDGVEFDMQRDRTVLHQGRFMNMLAGISPEDIEKVEVLKNATALYGIRGANGVVLITTKRGHSMATRIDASISAGVTLKPTTQSVMNASQYRNYATEMLGTIAELNKSQNRQVTFNFLNDDPNGYYYKIYHNDTDWKKEVYRTAMTQNYSINVQGGDDIGMYNLSVGYVDANSPIKETNFNRLNVRFNTDINLLWNFHTKFDMSFSRTNNKMYDDGFASDLSKATVTSPTALALIKSPLVTPYQYNKHVGGFTSLLSDYDDLYSSLSQQLYDNDYYYSIANPTAIISKGEGDNKNKVENTFFNVHVEPTYEFSDNLKLTTLFSYILNRNSQRYYRPSKGVPPFEVAGLGTVYNKTSSLFAKETNVLSHTHLDWKQLYGPHYVTVSGGFRYNYFSFDGSDASTQFNFSEDDKNPYLTANPNVSYSVLSGDADVWKNMQWYATSDYNYMNRYFATVSLLAEANSRMGDKAKASIKLFGARWAIFPSVQLGWIITNEDWFPKTKTLNYLKLTAGFDISGNDNISNYAARTSFSSVRYNYTAIGMQLTNIGNDEIKWETTQKWNLGLQANFLQNRVSMNANFFAHMTRNLVTLSTFYSPIAGMNNYWTNGGSLENKGLEFSVSGKPVVSKDWNLEVGVTLGHYKNKLTSLPVRTFTDGTRTFTDGSYCASIYGQNNILVSKNNPVGLFYGYETKGVFASDEEAKNAGNGTYLYMYDDAGNKVNFNAGDVHFVDKNGDGIIDENDKVVIGDPNPDIYGNIFATLKWKNFTFDANFTYSVGNDVYNYQRSILNGGSTFYNQQVAEVGHWRYEGQQTDLPRIAYGDPKGNNRFSDRWIENGSYLRLKSMRLTYQIPIPESWQSWLMGLTVWGEAQNIFTITKYKGDDPEFSVGNGVLYQGIDAGYISQCRSFVLGLKINL